MLIDLVHNVALLLALALLYDTIALKPRRAKQSLQQLIIGVTIGTIGIVVMLSSWEFTPGIIFDTRSILLGIAGLFFGTVPTLIAVLMTAGLRLYQGGGGVWMGVAVIITSGGIGLAWRHLRHNGLEDISILKLYLFGVVVHLAMLLETFLLPWSVVFEVLSKISLPVIILYPIGTVLLGKLMIGRLVRQQTKEKLKASNQQLRATEQQLRAVNQQLTSHLANTPLGGIFWDVDFKVTDWNKSAEKIFGYSKEEALGKHANELIVPKEIQPQIDDVFKHLLTRTGGERSTNENITKTGNTILCDWYNVAVTDLNGKVTGVASLVDDITEWKKNEQIQNVILNISNAVVAGISMEEFLSTVKTELGTIIDVSNFFIALYDETMDNFDLIYHNDQYDKFTTFPAGKSLTAYVAKTKKPLLANESVIDKLIKSGKVKQIGTLSKVWLGVPMFSKGKVSGVIAVQSYENENTFDKSDMKTLEIISHQISISLERKKAEQDLRDALEKAEEMNRVKSHFFATMSHELRTPFVAIKGYAEFLLERLTDQGNKEFAEGIISGADRLQETLNKILSLTKLEFDKREIELNKINLPEVINDSFKLFSKTAEKKNLNCIKNIFTERSYNEEELIIKFDEEALRDILNNLLSNAIKYTEKGSIELKTDIEKRNEGEFLVIKVTDTGIGIPKEKQALIWDEFRQVSEGQSRSFEGTGLGLAITKKRVELLGGEISVESEEGKGSSFIVELPILRTGQVEKSTAVKNKNDEPTETVETNSLQISKKILYVEDDKYAQDLVRRILSKDYKIDIVVNDKEALEKVKSQNYDAFLIDVNLGKGMDGVELMEYLRKMPEYESTPMMAITAYAADSDREEFLSRGFTHYISKPFKLELLKKTVAEMFNA